MDATARFLLLGEPLALDLVNTRICRDGTIVDLLDTRAALGAWLRAERGHAPWRGTVTLADLAAVRGLRNAIDALLRARRAGTRPPPDALESVNRALATGHGRPYLEWRAAGPRMVTAPAGARRQVLMHALARDAVNLLTGPHARCIRECAHPACRLQFLAVNPRRRWCSSATCGNRTRVAQHYRRHHHQPA